MHGRQFIGCIGGLVAGLVLIIIDLILRRQSQLNDTYGSTRAAIESKPAGDTSSTTSTAKASTHGPDRDALMAGCILRIILCR